MTEATVSRKLREALSSLGAVAWKVSDRFHASRPDLIVAWEGRFIAIEVKIEPNEPTGLQRLTLNDLVYVEAEVYVAYYHKTTKWIALTHLNYGHTCSFQDIKEAAKWLLRPLS